jgi:peroxiredoxin
MNKQFAPLIAVLLLAFAGPVLGESTRSEIHAAAIDVQPLLPGMQAPSFNVMNAKGETVHYAPAAMQKPLVVTFFRGGWCPYCNLHLAEMRKAESELEELGFDIWFISIDRPEMLYKSLEQPDITYTILSDSKLEATRAFGVAFRVDDETIERYQQWEIDLEAASGESHHVLPAPSTFLIGADGVIRFQYTNPEYAVRLHPDVLLAAARAYKGDEDSRLRRQQKARREAMESAN